MQGKSLCKKAVNFWDVWISFLFKSHKRSPLSIHFFFPLEGIFPPILYKKESLEFALSIIRILKCMVALWKLYLRALLQYKLINWI